MAKSRVRKLKRELEIRLKKLEKLIEQMEWELRGSFITTFINAVLTEYQDVIEAECRSIARKLGLQYMDEEDVAQEAIEYLIRWCLPASLKRSTSKHVWLPYLKRSINNCYVNLYRKSTTISRKMNYVYIDDGLAGQAALRKYDIDNAIDMTHELRYRELIRIVAGELPDETRTIFLGIISPPKEVIEYIRGVQESGGTTNNSMKILAKYYGMSDFRFKRHINIISETIKENSHKV